MSYMYLYILYTKQTKSACYSVMKPDLYSFWGDVVLESAM